MRGPQEPQGRVREGQANHAAVFTGDIPGVTVSVEHGGRLAPPVQVLLDDAFFEEQIYPDGPLPARTACAYPRGALFGLTLYTTLLTPLVRVPPRLTRETAVPVADRSPEGGHDAAAAGSGCEGGRAGKDRH